MRSFFIGILTLILCIHTAASAQDVKQGDFEVHELSENVHVLSYVWRENVKINVGVVEGDTGLLLISSFMASTAPALEAHIQKLSSKPIKYVFNLAEDTFHHHVNKYFADRGATIISHEVLQSIAEYTEVTFKDKLTLNLGKETLTAYYTPAHTKAQTIVHLRESNIIFMGDALRTDWLMFIGPNGVTGQLAGLDFAASLANGTTKFVQGNRGKKVYNSKTELIEAKATLLSFSERVDALSKQGLSAEEIANDPQIIELVKPLEQYEYFSPYLKEHVEELLNTTKSK